MAGRLTQPCRVQEEGVMRCKLLLYGKKKQLRLKLPVPYE